MAGRYFHTHIYNITGHGLSFYLTKTQTVAEHLILSEQMLKANKVPRPTIFALLACEQ
jgi:hypothetical protein